MAKKANGYSQDQIKRFVSQVENLQDEIDKVMDAAKEECQPHREEMRQVFKDAGEEGINVKALRKAVAARRAEKKVEKAREELKTLDRDAYDAIRHLLGDLEETPLGKAALARVRASQTEQSAAAH